MVDVETYVSSVSSINEKDMVRIVRFSHIRQKCRQELYVGTSVRIRWTSDNSVS